MADEPHGISINAVVFKEGDWWVAQCLEYDMTAQAKSLDDLPYELERTLITHLAASVQEGQEAFVGIAPAPQKYWDMFERSRWHYDRNVIPFRTPKPVGATPVVRELRMAA